MKKCYDALEETKAFVRFELYTIEDIINASTEGTNVSSCQISWKDLVEKEQSLFIEQKKDDERTSELWNGENEKDNPTNRVSTYEHPVSKGFKEFAEKVRTKAYQERKKVQLCSKDFGEDIDWMIKENQDRKAIKDLKTIKKIHVWDILFLVDPCLRDMSGRSNNIKRYLELTKNSKKK